MADLCILLGTLLALAFALIMMAIEERACRRILAHQFIAAGGWPFGLHRCVARIVSLMLWTIIGFELLCRVACAVMTP